MLIDQIQLVVITRLRQYTKNKLLDTGEVFLNRNTLRLRPRGKNLMCQYYEFWKLDPPNRTSSNTISLLRKMTYPYYLNNKNLILFSEQDAFMCKLAGVQGWLDAK